MHCFCAKILLYWLVLVVVFRMGVKDGKTYLVLLKSPSVSNILRKTDKLKVKRGGRLT